MTKQRIFCITVSAISIMVAGCAKTDSTNIKTSGIVADYSISPNTNGTAVCTAKYYVGGENGTIVDLEGGDNVTCNGVAMQGQNDFIGNTYYTATVTANPGDTVTMTLNRSGENPYPASVSLSPVMQVTSPSPGSSFQKGAPVVVTWRALTDTTLAMNGNFYASAVPTASQQASAEVFSLDASGIAPNTGSYTWTSGQTQITPPQPGNWTGQINLGVSKFGSMPTGLAGTISSVSGATLTVTLTD